jgi:hypothetical protein
MLDYVSAGIAFYITMLPVQEWILEFRLGYLGRYWSLISVAGLFIGFLLCTLIFVPLIINMALDPFRYPDHNDRLRSLYKSSHIASHSVPFKAGLISPGGNNMGMPPAARTASIYSLGIESRTSLLYL